MFGWKFLSANAERPQHDLLRQWSRSIRTKPRCPLTRFIEQHSNSRTNVNLGNGVVGASFFQLHHVYYLILIVHFFVVLTSDTSTKALPPSGSLSTAAEIAAILGSIFRSLSLVAAVVFGIRGWRTRHYSKPEVSLTSSSPWHVSSLIPPD